LHTPDAHDALSLFVVSHATPQPPQFVADSVTSQPALLVPVLSQSKNPGLQPEYVQPLEPHVPPRLRAASHVVPQPPHAIDSQPFALVPDVSQSEKPALHPVYLHTPMSHVAPRLLLVSHATPQLPQFVIESSLVSQPSSSVGGVGWMQSP
jgi:hypothetical protein